MAIQIVEQNVISGKVTDFKFNGKVFKKVVGIRWLELHMEDAHVKLLKISLSVNQNADDVVNVQAHVAMSDARSPDELDRSKSQLFVSVIAWIAPDAATTMMENATGIIAGSRSRAVTLPSSKSTVLQSFLSGLDMSFANDDHHVASITAAVGTEQDQSTGYLTAVASLDDRSGSLAKASIDAGVIASSDTNPGFVVHTTQLEGGEQALSFPPGTTKVFPLIQSIQVTFAGNEDHHLWFLMAGGWTTTAAPDAAGKISVNGAVWIRDSSGNREDSKKSSVGLVVIGY
jgi:hypothetical protein